MRRLVNYKYSIVLVLLTLVSGVSAWAQDAAATEAAPAPEASSDGWMFWGLTTVVLFIVFLMISVFAKLKGLEEDEYATTEKVSFKQKWAELNQRIFTKAVPVEKEEDILLDHDYDGIKELDNALPPWWKWGFYITVVVAVIYFVRFHVLETGPTPEQEYNTEMSMAAAQMEEYRKKSNNMVDEKTVTMADAAGIADGKQIFQKSCFMCHGSNGEGSVGPNLTDDFWLHGGSINDVFKTIKYGVTDKGMQAWEKTYSPSQIKNLASYIKSLRGTNPANAKAPQGEAYTEAATADSTATIRKESVTLNK